MKKNNLRYKKRSNKVEELKQYQPVDIVSSFSALELQKKEIQIKQNLMLEKALKSNDPYSILGANTILQQNNQNRNKSKSYLFDPQYLNQSLGFKDKGTNVTYGLLRQMAKAPIVKAIIGTRVDQVAAFSEPQDDINKIGWSIRKKKRLFQKEEKELTDIEKVEIENLVNFVQNCGGKNKYKRYHGDSFDKFLRKTVKDSLELDQDTFEIIPNRLLKPLEFFATDAATYRLASSYMNENCEKEQEEINGVYPFYVQLYQGIVHADFYPWELSFGVRNLSTSIYNLGYGTSELEDMVNIITWQLFADQYNGKFFSQGSSPKGILAIKGDSFDEDKLAEFRGQWKNQVSGVENAWKIPILPGDEVQFINMQMNNSDMQFAQWQEYLIRLTCALYKIAPEEIGFVLNGGASGGINYNGDQEYKLEFSQDKGLMPLLKYKQAQINKDLIEPLSDGKYEFFWTGIKDTTEDSDLENDIRKFETGILSWKELRKKHNKPPELEHDDFLGNQIWLQVKQMKMQQSMGGNPFSNGAVEGEMSNPFQSPNGNGVNLEQYATQNESIKNNDFFNPFQSAESALEDKNNPFMKDFLSYMEDILIK